MLQIMAIIKVYFKMKKVVFTLSGHAESVARRERSL